MHELILLTRWTQKTEHLVYRARCYSRCVPLTIETGNFVMAFRATKTTTNCEWANTQTTHFHSPQNAFRCDNTDHSSTFNLYNICCLIIQPDVVRPVSFHQTDSSSWLSNHYWIVLIELKLLSKNGENRKKKLARFWMALNSRKRSYDQLSQILSKKSCGSIWIT